MSSSQREHHSFSMVIVPLILILLLLNPHVGLCSCYKRIFSFGDSIIDTGNFVHLAGNAASKYNKPPYGTTFFKHATGRVCDGRVLVDFYAQALQLQPIPPYIPNSNKDSTDFPHGANFAVVGATARGLRYSGPLLNDTVRVPWSLGMQMYWLEEMAQQVAPGDDAQGQFMHESLILLGQIGGNDYDSWFSSGGPREDIEYIIPEVITYISHYVEELAIYYGAKTFVIPNSFPIGCWASYLSRFHSDNPKDYDEHGCLRWLNEVSRKHNQALHDEIARLRYYHPGVKLIYADYYGAAMEFIKNPGRFGIGDPLVACCGGGGRYHTGMECNSTAKVWGDPSSFANWDGMHLTEKAYNIIANGVLNGSFADPPFHLSC